MLGALYFTGQAKADVPYEESAYHYGYKDIVPRHEERRWHRKQPRYDHRPHPTVREQRYIGDEGQPLYTGKKIKAMCLKLADERQQGTITWYDLDYKRWVCDFGQGYYDLNRYAR